MHGDLGVEAAGISESGHSPQAGKSDCSASMGSVSAGTQEALAQQLHPLEVLRLLLEDEVLARKARFWFRANLEDWDDTIPRGVPPAKIAELAQLSFLYNRENLLIIGTTGLGKTHLAIALGIRLCQEEHATQFLLIHFLFEEVFAARAAGCYLSYGKSLTKRLCRS